MNTSKFARKTGKVVIPCAEKIIPDKESIEADIIQRDTLSVHKVGDLQILYPYKFCRTNLKDGCYTISISPSPLSFFNRGWEGTIRVDNSEDDICISGDLYKKKQLWVTTSVAAKDLEVIRPAVKDVRASTLELNPALTLFKKRIPIYPRRRYYAYLLGTSAKLASITRRGDKCSFSLDFDVYEFDHDETGFEGTFPVVPTKTIRLSLQHTSTANKYTGKMYEGDVEKGTVSIERVSSYFRKAYLDIHKLTGAETPQAVDDPDGTGQETFRTIFDTAGWNLTVSYKTTALNIPPSLVGIQATDECWNRENAHELLETVSTYDPDKLDKKWKVHLIAIPGRLGCSRGRMFDNELRATDIGDVNNVAREGAVTYSHDGYDSPSFGDNEDDLQKDTPRAFIRSAAHEVGHAFNMIHQSSEGGSDNSIMTVSPGVASVLNASGLDFPEDIDLSFNSTCRHHLIHRPDPWVRPGALEFTGSLAGSPEADDVYFYDLSQLVTKITIPAKNIKLGEILNISWKVTNTSKKSIVFPKRITDCSFTARISITYPDGSIKYIKPVNVNSDIENPLTILKAGQSCSSETTLFWNKKGFVFMNPGRHVININILWADEDCYSCVSSSEECWVDYPVTVQENAVASLLLNENVGRYVALKGRKPNKEAIRRIEKVVSRYKTHPACEILKEIPGHRYSRV